MSGANLRFREFESQSSDFFGHVSLSSKHTRTFACKYAFSKFANLNTPVEKVDKRDSPFVYNFTSKLSRNDRLGHLSSTIGIFIGLALAVGKGVAHAFFRRKHCLRFQVLEFRRAVARSSRHCRGAFWRCTRPRRLRRKRFQ